MKVESTQQALIRAARKLVDPDYQTEHDFDVISRKFLSQAIILDLREDGKTYTEIGVGVGVSERTIRYWENGKQCPTLDNAITLACFYVRTIPRQSRK
jgi:DNA-binding XRE family transcriptional regulator